jgi:hypothetical protein
MNLQTSGASRRGIAELYPDEAIQSRYSAPSICFAAPAMGGALPDPLARNDDHRSKSAWQSKFRTIRNRSLLQVTGDSACNRRL